MQAYPGNEHARAVATIYHGHVTREAHMAPQRGVFTLSLDFELAWGSRDLYDPINPLLAMARVTRSRVFEPLLAMLVEHNMVATWATVGSLFLSGAERRGCASFPDLTPPTHRWYPRPWFETVPGGTEAEHPEFYARSLVVKLRDAGQEIGSHSFSHPIFGDAGCSRQAAETDVARCVAEAAHIGVTLRSFVFPRNVAGHVDLLRKYGFTSWRGPEPSWYHRAGIPSPVKRVAHMADVALARSAPTVRPFRDQHGLWVIPASASFFPMDGVRRIIPLEQRVRRCIKGLDQAAVDGRICHLWFHPINLASDPERMLGALRRVIQHASELRDRGRIEVLPMGEVATRAESGDIVTTQGAAVPSAPSSP